MSFLPELSDSRAEQIEAFSDHLAHLLSLTKPKIVLDSPDPNLPSTKLARARKVDGIYHLTFSEQSVHNGNQNVDAHEVAHAFIHENNPIYDAMDAWFEENGTRVLSENNSGEAEASQVEVTELINTLFVLTVYEEAAASLIGTHFSTKPQKPLDNRFLGLFNEYSYSKSDRSPIGRLYLAKEIASQIGMYVGESIARQGDRYSGYGFGELNNESMREFLCMNPIDFVKKTQEVFHISPLGFSQTFAGLTALEKRFSKVQ